MHAEPIAYRFDVAAQMIGISHDALRRLVKAGRIRAFHVGHATCVSAEDLRGFIDECAREHALQVAETTVQ